MPEPHLLLLGRSDCPPSVALLTTGRFFAPKLVNGVGTFQDAGPLENDPLMSAVKTVGAEDIDYLLSLGTGEPKPSSALSAMVPKRFWQNNPISRLAKLIWEKMRDENVRQALHGHPRYHRLNIQFDGDEPRLDDTSRMLEVATKAGSDVTLSQAIDDIARCMVSSLFYFELDSTPRRQMGRYSGAGHILCSIRNNDPAFHVLLDRLSRHSAQFWIRRCPIDVVDKFSFDAKGNYRKRVEIEADDNFTVTLKQDSSNACHISGSPFSISKLILQQGLTAVFGRADHRKRKSMKNVENEKSKRRRLQ